MSAPVEGDLRGEEEIARTITSIVYESGMSPQEINNGWCFWFAGELAKALGSASRTVSTDGLDLKGPRGISKPLGSAVRRQVLRCGNA